MAWCVAGQILNSQGLVFIPNMEKLLLWVLKQKGKIQINVSVASEWKIKECKVFKPFWWRSFSSYNCCENMKIGVLSSKISIRTTNWKQLSDLRNKNGNVLYIKTSKLTSTFRTIGKATGIKMTAKVVGKNSSSHFNMKN